MDAYSPFETLSQVLFSSSFIFKVHSTRVDEGNLETRLARYYISVPINSNNLFPVKYLTAGKRGWQSEI